MSADTDLEEFDDVLLHKTADALIGILPRCSNGLPSEDLVYAEQLISVLIDKEYRPRPQEIEPLMKIAVLLAEKEKENGFTLADLLGIQSVAPPFIAMLESALVADEMKKAPKPRE